MTSKSIRRAALALVAALALAPALTSVAFAQAPSKLETEDQKILYALGVAVGQNLGVFNLTAEELAIVQRGLADSAMKREPKVPMDQYGPKIQAMAQTRAEAAAASS